MMWDEDEVQEEARLATRGFEEKGGVQADNLEADKNDIGLVLAATTAYTWETKSPDIKSTLLQEKKLNRRNLLEPPPEPEGAKRQPMPSGMDLYELYWVTLKYHMKVKKELTHPGCKQGTGDHILFYKHDREGKLMGAKWLGWYELLHHGAEEVEEMMMKRTRKIYSLMYRTTMQEGGANYLGERSSLSLFTEHMSAVINCCDEFGATEIGVLLRDISMSSLGICELLA